MKRPILIGVGVIVLVLVGVGSWFAWKNLRGAIPAFSGPDGNIVEQIEEQEPQQETVPKPQEQGDATATADLIEPNTTNFPLKLPDGMTIGIYAKGLGGVRDLFFEPKAQVLLATVPTKGTILAFHDKDRNSKADETVTVAKGLKNPHGITVIEEFGKCVLFVAEETQVTRFDYDCDTLTATNPKKILDLPASGGGHWTRSLLAHDGRLLVAIGSSCNVCTEKDERRATIQSVNFDGSDAKMFAKGLRNSVFMEQRPGTDDVWATEMGRDLLGDNTPPEEVNIIREGANYGWPICYGNNIHDTNFDKNTYIRNPCMEPFETPPHVEMQAHSAPLGLAFFNEQWPKEYQGDMLVAFHGSWNRTQPTGYMLERIKLDAQGNAEGQEDFISGWLTSKNKTLGRPVDVLIQGKYLFVSDDKAGVIYEVTAP